MGSQTPDTRSIDRGNRADHSMPRTQDDRLRRRLIRSELARVDKIDPADHASCSKHLKMAQNPFRFLRGSAQLFYADLGNGILTLPDPLCDKVPLTAVVGDCHVANFGFITEEGSHGDRVVFCPNDYDDACIGHAAWDLSRFIVSLFLAADYCRGLVDGRYGSIAIDSRDALKAASNADAQDAAQGFLKAYVRACEDCVKDPDHRQSALDDFDKGHVLRRPFKKAKRRAPGGRDFETKSTLAKEIEVEQGRLGFRADPERFQRLDDALARAVRKTFRPYVNDCILDLVLRIGAGTGSVNVTRYYLLVGPERGHYPADLPLCQIVEVKQQRQASALYHFPELSPVNRLDSAHLTVDCQRLMQRSPDLVLDEARWQGTHWLIRSRHHARVGIDPEDIALAENKPGKHLEAYAAACGEALALAHARGDRRSTRFEAAIAKRLPRCSDELIDSTATYAAQVIRDCALLRGMLESSD